MIRLGVLGSTNGTDLQVILESVKAKKINAIVNVVISVSYTHLRAHATLR